MNNDKFGIGVIGCGGIANSVHLPSLAKASGAYISALCDIDSIKLKKTAEKYGVPESSCFTNYEDLISCQEVDAVDICTPNNLHCPMAAKALFAKKPFCIEKPMGISAQEAKALKTAADKSGLPSMICFSYRFYPAVRYAKSLIDKGHLGNINTIYAQYLKSSAFIPGRRLDWRFEESKARYGVSGDLAVHILDIVRFLAGDITGVFAKTGIAVKKRMELGRDVLRNVTTDDYCNFLAEVEGGISATFGISRCAYGNKNHIVVDIYGDKGALRFDLNHSDQIQVYVPDNTGVNEDMKTITVPDEYKSDQMQTFVDILHKKQPLYAPTLDEGLNCQYILDALLASSEQCRWIDINNSRGN